MNGSSSWALPAKGYPIDERKVVESSLELIERGKFTGITDKRMHEFLYPTSYENIELRTLIHDMAGSDAKEVYLRQLRATLDRRNLKEDMRNLEVPTLFLAGAQDKIVPVASIQRSAENCKHGFFSSVDHCGHFVPLEQPAAVNDQIEKFLAS